uniref:TMV resistance protein N-like n=1 Tax=Erigeron canadensis TaxID=72917 RepID=UPI001CB9418D|nr:TMV resistance protein N-like [Erigeron canadensis]
MELFDMGALVTTPDIGGLPCLQKLKLMRCESLEEIHQSLGNHSSLVQVHVTKCKKLRRFPPIVKMDRLETLEIEECGALVEFPKIEAKMDRLIKLSLTRAGIEVLPSSVGRYCTNLISLELSYCMSLKSIEGNFHALKCLEKFAIILVTQLDNLQQLMLTGCLRKLYLSSCNLKDGGIPNEVGELTGLQELDLSENDFTRLLQVT